MAQPSVSVVLPVYQEVQSVPRLHEALAQVADATLGGWEFLFVDDGSTDGSWEALRALQVADTRVRAIRLKRNFGQTAAMVHDSVAASGVSAVWAGVVGRHQAHQHAEHIVPRQARRRVRQVHVLEERLDVLFGCVAQGRVARIRRVGRADRRPRWQGEHHIFLETRLFLRHDPRWLFQVSDGTLTDSEDITITVNHAPSSSNDTAAVYLSTCGFRAVARLATTLPV